jgi:hypothetical protein
MYTLFFVSAEGVISGFEFEEFPDPEAARSGALRTLLRQPDLGGVEVWSETERLGLVERL